MNREDSDNGEILRNLLYQFHTEKNNENFYNVLQCLRDSNIWIPCDLIISSADENNLINGKKGDLISTENDIRIVPATLQNGEEYYFPVFSDHEQMGEEYQGFSKVEKHFFSAMKMANGDKLLTGIVLDAFSQPFVIRKDFFDYIGHLPSSYVDEL